MNAYCKVNIWILKLVGNLGYSCPTIIINKNIRYCCVIFVLDIDKDAML